VNVIGPDNSRNWLNNRSRFQWYRKWLINRRLAKKWLKHEAVQAADIVHSHSLIRPFGAMIAEAAEKPHVWHFHEQAMPHLERPFLRPTSWVRQWIQNRTARVVVPSDSLKQYATTYMDEEAITVVPNGLLGAAGDFPEYRPLSRMLKPVRISVIGRMGEAKGTFDAIRVLGFLDTAGIDAEMRFAGDVSDKTRAEMECLADLLGVRHRMTFAGYLTDVSQELALCDIFLMPSHYESFGRVTVEAMAAAKPIVATASGGTLDILEDGVTGLLREPRDSASLAQAIIWLIDNPCDAEEMREEAWRTAYERFSRSTFAKRVRQVYDEVVQLA